MEPVFYLNPGRGQRHEESGERTNGSSIALRVCMVIKVVDGLISRIDEYFDPTDMAPLVRSTT